MRYPGDPIKKDWLFFSLGIAAPFVLGNVGSSVAGFLSAIVESEALFGAFAASGLAMMVIAPVTLLIIGRRLEDVRLRSFASGWLWGMAVPALLFLCAAGSCALLLSGSFN